MGIDIFLYITQGKVAAANTVHHIVELSEDWDKRTKDSNLISISDDTHSYISTQYKDDVKRQQLQQQLRGCVNTWYQVTKGEGVGV